MKTVKVGKPLIELVMLCYSARRPLLLVGRHGVGKSELLEQAARELEISYICRDLSLMEPPDLVGLPKLGGTVTRYLPPSFLPTSGKGLLVLEELNRCPSYMRAPCLQLLTARQLNDYQLPPGWLPVAAVNPAEDAYEVDELDPAMLSRFIRAKVVADREEWLSWARTAGIHRGVVDYVSADPTIFDAPESCPPRSWAYVSDVVHAAARCAASPESLRAAVVGLVGPVRGAAFLQVLRDEVRPLTAEEILAYPKHRAQLRGWIAAGKLDLAQASLLAVMKHLQARQSYEPARERRSTWKNLGQFLGDLPGDLREEAEAFFEERGYDVPQDAKRR